MKFLYYACAIALLVMGALVEPPDLPLQLFLTGLAICLMLLGVIDAIGESRK